MYEANTHARTQSSAGARLLFLACGMLPPPAFTVHLPTSLSPSWKPSHRYALFVTWLVLNPTRLTRWGITGTEGRQEW